MSDPTVARLDALDRRLARVELALWPEERPAPAPAASPSSSPSPSPSPLPEPTRPAPPAPARPSRKPAPPRPRRQIDWSAVFGPTGLAVVGAVVTVLGIVFFFALAVNRGWIGPVARVALGSTASLLVFGAGLELQRRYGRLHATLAAVGAGIAGGYATLLAATALYGLVPAWAALVVAGGIAAVGVAVSLAWRAQIVAAIGLIGAMVVPLLLVFDTGFTVAG